LDIIADDIVDIVAMRTLLWRPLAAHAGWSSTTPQIEVTAMGHCQPIRLA